MVKTRGSGMPDEAMWESFSDPPSVLSRLGLVSGIEVVVEFGCDYGRFALPAARLARGPIYAFDIESELVQRVRNKARQGGLRNVVCEVRDFIEQGTGLPSEAADYVMLFNILLAEERAHHSLTQLIPVETMHERKQRMAQLADAFVALPGGIGTLEEVTEMFTWLQLGLHLKPVGLLNVRGFYDLLLEFLAHMRDEKFLSASHHATLTVANDVESMLDRLIETKHGHVQKLVQPVTNAV